LFYLKNLFSIFILLFCQCINILPQNFLFFYSSSVSEIPKIAYR